MRRLVVQGGRPFELLRVGEAKITPHLGVRNNLIFKQLSYVIITYPLRYISF